MIRDQVVAAVVAQLQTINTGNGYLTDLAAEDVYEWRGWAFEPDETPALIVRDTTDTPAPLAYDTWQHALTIEIEAVAVAPVGQSTAAATLRNLLADILKAVQADETWGDLAENTVVTEIDLQKEEGTRDLGAAVVTLAIQYETANHAI